LIPVNNNMSNMKITGWVLVVLGLIAAWYMWPSSTVGAVIGLVVAAAGLWLALKGEGGAMM
jgi:hypothetical protein